MPLMMLLRHLILTNRAPRRLAVVDRPHVVGGISYSSWLINSLPDLPSHEALYCDEHPAKEQPSPEISQIAMY